MPIRPIDLQTMLMQMAQVGRDQAIEKDGPALQSAIQVALSQKKDIEAKDSVRKAEDAKEGAEPIREKRGQGQGKGTKGGENDSAGGEAEEERDEEVVRDPSLGNRIDLSG
jgi:hypothetical protein